MARSEQQQGVPRRPDRPHEQRHLDLLRGENFAGSQAPGNRQGHEPREFPHRSDRTAHGTASGLSDDDLQVFEVSERAKEYLRFMMEKEQYEPCQQAAIGYVTQPLKAYESNPIWTVDPKHTPYRDLMKNMLPNGYAGEMGYASAATMAGGHGFDMVAEPASGSKTPKEAVERAQKRAERYYKV